MSWQGEMKSSQLEMAWLCQKVFSVWTDLSACDVLTVTCLLAVQTGMIVWTLLVTRLDLLAWTDLTMWTTLLGWTDLTACDVLTVWAFSIVWTEVILVWGEAEEEGLLRMVIGYDEAF